MLRLFDQARVNSNPDLFEAVRHVTEHHARVLSRLEDSQTREELAIMIFREKLSIQGALEFDRPARSWFPARAGEYAASESREDSVAVCNGDDPYGRELRRSNRYSYSEFELVRQGDFDSFKSMHMFGEGYSLYGAFPPLTHYDNDRALPRERMWFYEIAPSLDCRISNVKIDLLGSVGLATLIVDYSGIYRKEQFRMRSRGTMVLLKRENAWRIFHEHWSAGSSTYAELDKAPYPDGKRKRESGTALP